MILKLDSYVSDGTEGKVCRYLKYTNQNIVPESKFQKAIADEIHRVRTKCKNSAEWNEDMRNGRTWADDLVDMATNIKNKRKAALVRQGVTTLGKLKRLTNQEIKCICSREPVLSAKVIIAARNSISLSINPKPNPMIKNHTLAENPYAS